MALDRWTDGDLSVPSTTVSGLEASLITNATAVVRWRPPFFCGELNGPASHFVWELHSGESTAVSAGASERASARPLQSGITTTMVVMLRDLTPLTQYEMRVNIANVVGTSPEHWSKLLFKTMHSLPDEPRLLAAYRRNSTAIWLRWEPPARPSGLVRRYVVSVKGPSVDSKTTVSPNAVCPAKPGFLCHVVSGLQPGKDYSIAVSAVNQYGDEPGPPAAVRVPANLGDATSPQRFSIKEFTARSVVLQWQLPDLINSDLHFFDVVVQGTYEAPRRIEVKAEEEKLWYECSVDNLKPGAVYTATVRCGPYGEVARLIINNLASEGGK